jgi:ActR/RegA family two-component response regulator
MTAHGTDAVALEAARLGVRAMLGKPLDVPALLAALAV